MRSEKIDPEEIDIRYSNWLSMSIDLIKPKNLYLIAGRGTAKTQDILAKRVTDIVYDMPAATMSFVSDSYVNAISNIIPELIEGLQRQKIYEGIHFVKDKEPPSFFKKSLRNISDYKHTMTWCNGVHFMVKSLDRPSMNAGISVVHQVGDEVKFLAEAKMKKAFPTLRGDSIMFGNSPYFMGHTFTTDRPNPNNNEHDWIEKMSKKMDIKQIYVIFQTAVVVNEIEWELYKAVRDLATKNTIDNIKLKLNRWKARLLKMRFNSSLFLIISTLANVDILTFEYLINQFETLEYEEFKTAILSLKPSLKMGERFYGALQDKHFYLDGYNYDYYDNLGISSNMSATCKGLKYINSSNALEAGVDFGNMLSMVIGQEQGNTMRIVKNMYTLTPLWIQDLADSFVSFFEPHGRKHLYLYYDRAGNNLAKAKQDYASQLKKAIETNRSGKRTGWIVSLMSIGQGNIPQGLEFDMMNVVMNETNLRLPIIRIDKHECKELKTSLELAPVKKVISTNGKTRIVKDKSSEKKSVERLPTESTNMSDAFKYLMMRPKWINIFKSKS